MSAAPPDRFSSTLNRVRIPSTRIWVNLRWSVTTSASSFAGADDVTLSLLFSSSNLARTVNFSGQGPGAG